MSKLKMSSFKLSEDDNMKLNALVEDAIAREANSVFPLRINRTSLIQQLISLAFIKLQENQAQLLSSVARSKKRLAKKKRAKVQPVLIEA